MVHHLETVVGSFPNCSDSHLLVRCFSTSTIFILFKSFLSIIRIFVWIKVLIVSDTFVVLSLILYVFKQMNLNIFIFTREKSTKAAL